MTPSRDPPRLPSAARGQKGRTSRGAGPLLSCRIKVTLPSNIWMRSFSVSHPSTRIEVLDRLEVDRQRVLFEVRIATTEGGSWGEEIRRLPQVAAVELIDATAGEEVYRVLFGGKTFLPLLKRLKLLRHFPFPIQDGVATWTLVGAEGKIRRLLRSLQASRIGVDLESVHQGPLVRIPSSLTPRQRELLRRAIDEGYFDVPRRISLTRLAPRIGVAVSTLSVTLAVIEKKIVESMMREERESQPVPPRWDTSEPR